MKRGILGLLVALALALAVSLVPAAAAADSSAEVGWKATSKVIGISVSPESIDFGVVSGGATISGDPLTVTNTGNVDIDVTAEITADTEFAEGQYFFTAALRLNSEACDKQGAPTALEGAWTAAQLGLAGVVPDAEPEVSTGLECPATIYPAIDYTGTVIFWAEEAEEV